MTELSDKLKPNLVCTLSDQQVGMTTTLTPLGGQQKVVRSNYGWGEFAIDLVTFSPGASVPSLEAENFVGNSPFIRFVGGGVYVPLWKASQPRAWVAQLSLDERTLYYVGGGHGEQNSIGRVELNGENSNVLEPLGQITGKEINYFLFLRDGRIATMESQDPSELRVYGLREGKLVLDTEKKLGFSLAYGLCQDSDNELMFLIPRQGNYPLDSVREPGVYRVSIKEGTSIGDLVRDVRFDKFEMPTDLRSMVPVFGKDNAVKSFLVGDYKHTRAKGVQGCGGQGSIFHLPME